MSDVKNRRNRIGSSDAEMVARIGRLGHVPESYNLRLGQLIGEYEPQQITTDAIEKGNYMEVMFYELISEKWFGEKRSNPLFISKNLRYTYFDVMNHIDVEILDKLMIIWFEHKATNHDDINEVFKKYFFQLQWHCMLLEERADQEGTLPILKLAWFSTKKNSLEFMDVKPEYGVFELFKRGLDILDKHLTTFEFKMPETVEAAYLPDTVKMVVEQTANYLAEINRLNDEVSKLKETLKVAMERAGIKKIDNEYLSITYVPEGETARLDTAKLKVEMPEIAEKYMKVTRRKSYVNINGKYKKRGA
jgi:hypothetical protein